MTQSQKEFEAWCKSSGQFYDLSAAVEKKGSYHENDTEEAFRAFCAGMKSVSVELPLQWWYAAPSDYNHLSHYVYPADRVKEALDKAGITYK